jgi:hypothetical protein
VTFLILPISSFVLPSAYKPTLKMEVVESSEALIYAQQITMHHIQGDSNLNNIVACKPVAKQRPVNSNRGTVFSVQSVPRCYNQDKLGGVSRSRVAVAETRGHFENPEDGERSPLRAVTRKRLVKTQEASKT